MTELELPQTSVIMYTLVTTIGQVPAEDVLLVTVMAASDEHPSEMATPSDSSAATVVTAAGAAEAEQPEMVAGAMEPVMVGGVLSITLIT